MGRDKRVRLPAETKLRAVEVIRAGYGRDAIAAELGATGSAVRKWQYSSSSCSRLLAARALPPALGLCPRRLRAVFAVCGAPVLERHPRGYPVRCHGIGSGHAVVDDALTASHFCSKVYLACFDPMDNNPSKPMARYVKKPFSHSALGNSVLSCGRPIAQAAPPEERRRLPSGALVVFFLRSTDIKIPPFLVPKKWGRFRMGEAGRASFL